MIKEIEVKKIKIPRYFKKYTAPYISALKKSIKEHGQFEAILVSKDLVCIDGKARVIAFRQLRRKKIRCIVITNGKEE
jgi:ParB-like chromosome segregation protein Spo0J